MSFVTPDFKQEQAASRAQKPGGRGREEGAGRPRPVLEAARASPAPPGAEERVLPQLETQRTRQLPGEKRVLEKGRAHARAAAGRAYLQGGARALACSARKQGAVRGLAAPYYVIAVGFIPFVKSFQHRQSE